MTGTRKTRAAKPIKWDAKRYLSPDAYRADRLAGKVGPTAKHIAEIRRI